jgi:signal transduction histidine kinase
MSISATLLALILGTFVVMDYRKSLEHDLVNTMRIMADDIAEHGLYNESPQILKDIFTTGESYHEANFLNYIKNLEFSFKDSLDENLSNLQVSKKLPDGRFLLITSSSVSIDEKVNSLLLELITGLLLGLSLIIGAFHLLLKKLLHPLKCLVNYCHNASSDSGLLPKCNGSYEVNSLKEAILELQQNNKVLCQEKQNIFKEAAHEIKTPIAILKARLSLFDKSDMPKNEFIKESMSDISTISNKLRELIFLKAIEWDIKQAKEYVQMQNQCGMMQQLFRPILEKKSLQMISDLKDDFALYIHREAMGRVMQAIFENIFMHTKSGTTIYTYVDAKKHQLKIVNEIGEASDEILFSSHIGTKLIQRLSEQLEYEYSIEEKEGLFYTTIIFKDQFQGLCKI